MRPLKPLPIGHSFFERIIEGGYYYVDKTLFIKDILDKGATVTLCTRPRRFGKTLNQTMLKCFFEDTAKTDNKNTHALFNGLKIEQFGERYLGHQGKYPVIFLSFKESKLPDFDGSYDMLTYEISGEFRRHEYVKEKIFDKTELGLFEKIATHSASLKDYSKSLRLLSKCLEKYYGEKAIVLIDEYDVPLENSWSSGFYQEMASFIRPLLSGALKDNPHLQFAVITGCLRISKESVFTGLNNLDIMSVLSSYYSEYFGFTQAEINALLGYYDLENNAETIKRWYDGYLFGKTEVYNPWSVINCVSDWRIDSEYVPRPYWVNTSANDIVRKLINKADDETRANLEVLMAGQTIQKVIYEDITYDEVDNNVNNLWSFMFFTGYLKKTGESRLDENDAQWLDLSIPNIELKYIYTSKIQEWFREKIELKDFSKFYEAILNGNAKEAQEELGKFLLETISYMDGREDFYHGIMLGILSGIRNYYVNSNRESGLGRCDIIMKHSSGRGKAIIFELKCTSNMHEIEKKSQEALEQIDDNMYGKELEVECYSDIIKYGIAFCKKSCEIRKAL